MIRLALSAPCLVIAAALVALAMPSLADEVESVQDLGGSVTELHAVAGAAERSPSVLAEIGAARAAIAAGDNATAEAALNTAAEHLDELRKLNPAVNTQEAIAKADEAAGANDPDAALVALTPVAEGLEVKQDYSDAVEHLRIVTSHKKHVSKSREGIMRAMNRLKEKNVEYARAELKTAKEEATYTEVDLPILVVTDEVQTARAALADGQAKIADEHLAAAETRAKTIVEVSQKAAAELSVAAEPPPES